MFSKIASIVATSVVFAATVNAQDCARNYTVRLGDYCDRISANLNVSTYQLAYTNPSINADCSNLAVGMPLCLGFVGQDCSTTTVVQSGDSCPAIEEAAGVDLPTLLHNNPNINEDCSNIYPGEVFCTSADLFDYDA